MKNKSIILSFIALLSITFNALAQNNGEGNFFNTSFELMGTLKKGNPKGNNTGTYYIVLEDDFDAYKAVHAKSAKKVEDIWCVFFKEVEETHGTEIFEELVGKKVVMNASKGRIRKKDGRMREPSNITHYFVVWNMSYIEEFIE